MKHLINVIRKGGHRIVFPYDLSGIEAITQAAIGMLQLFYVKVTIKCSPDGPSPNGPRHILKIKVWAKDKSSAIENCKKYLNNIYPNIIYLIEHVQCPSGYNK